MSLPIVIANNQTAGAIVLDRLGLTVPLSGTLTLTDFAFVNEIKQDETLHAAIVANNILLDLGQGELSKGDSLKFFAVTTLEVRRSVRALADTNVVSLSGTTTIDTVSLAVDDRVVLTAQTSADENGIWVVKAGAWARPSDFSTGDSSAGAIVTVQEGTTYSDQVWQVTTNTGADIVGTDTLGLQQISGGGGGSGSLQDAYVVGNTINATSGEGNIAFTLASADFTVDGANDVLFGTTTPLAIFNVDTGLMSLDSTDTTNLTMTANDGANKTLTIAATNAGAGDGLITMSADGTIDLDAGGALSINSSGGAINIGDDAVSQPINIGTGAAARVITVGNATGTTAVDVDTGTGGYDLDSLGTIEMDGVGTSNWTTDSGTVTIGTTTSGAINLSSVGAIDAQAAGNVTIDSSGGTIGIGTDADTGAINIGTSATSRVVTVGNTTGTSALNLNAGTGNILMTAPTTTMTGNLVVQGTTTTIESEIVNIADQYLYLNDGFDTTGSPQDGGLVINVNPLACNTTVATGGFTAGVAATSNPTVAITEIQTTIGVGSNGASLPQATINVADTTGYAASGTVFVTTSLGVQTVTYTGTTATTFTGCTGGTGVMSTGGLVSDSADAIVTGAFVQIKASNDQTNDGLYEVLSNENGLLTISGVGTSGTTFNFTQNDFITDTVVAGTIRCTEVGVTGISSTGDPQAGYGDNSTTFTFNTVVTSATISLQLAYDGGNTIVTAGGLPVLISGSEKVQITATGGLDLDTIFDFDGTSFDVLMSGNNGFSIDGTADSNLTATNTAASTPVTLSLGAANTGAVAGDATVDITATSVNGVGIVEIQADDNINVGTDAAAIAVVVGNNTGATGVTIDSGTEQVEIDGVTHYGSGAGLPTATASGFQDGDKYWDTDLETEMRYDATRSKWLSIETMTLMFGRDGNQAPNTYYRGGGDGRVMSATSGYIMPFASTIVGLGYTRTDTDAATFECTEDGAATTAAAELASTALKGAISTLDGDVAALAILSVRNKAAGATTSNVIGWVRVKFRSV